MFGNFLKLKNADGILMNDLWLFNYLSVDFWFSKSYIIIILSKLRLINELMVLNFLLIFM